VYYDHVVCKICNELVYNPTGPKPGRVCISRAMNGPAAEVE
jgi:hypothetical protein